MNIRLRRRARTTIAGLGLSLLPTVGAFAVKAADGAGDAVTLVGWVNDFRTSRGLRPLEPHPELEQKAQRWSAHLASIRSLEHSRLSEGISSPWLSLAENVAVSGTPAGAHEALLASPRHLANIVDPDMNRIGVGLTVTGGVVYVVEEFMQLSTTTGVTTPTITTHPARPPAGAASGAALAAPRKPAPSKPPAAPAATTVKEPPAPPATVAPTTTTTSPRPDPPLPPLTAAPTPIASVAMGGTPTAWLAAALLAADSATLVAWNSRRSARARRPRRRRSEGAAGKRA